MKTLRPLPSLIVVLLVLITAGCAATPEDRWYQQRESLNTANRIYLAHVPRLSDEQVIHYGELLQIARAHLDTAHAHLPDGGSSFDTTLDLIESILVRIVALDTSGDPAVPLTQPKTP